MILSILKLFSRSFVSNGISSLRKEVEKMVRYMTYALLITAVEVAVLFGISLYFDANMLTTMFFGSCFFILVAFLMGSSGDIFTKNSEVAVFNSFLGSYKPRHEKAKLTISPFLTGSLLCLVVYFVADYIL